MPATINTIVENHINGAIYTPLILNVHYEDICSDHG